MRLDRYLRDCLAPEHGRRAVTTLLRMHDIRVNGRRASKGQLLHAGDEITVPERALQRSELIPTPIELAILHCDRAIVAIDKPPGMPTTGGMSPLPSVAGALLSRFPEMATIDRVRAAGLVHRLDTATSGLLVAARTPMVHRRLRSAFAAKAILKEYVAVVEGRLRDAGRVAQRLARHPRSRKRMIAASAERGWRAETAYTPLAHASDATLVRLRMRTGVTHQLRVHMAELGHPVLGDRRYGRRTANTARGDSGSASWHYLHAYRMVGDDPDLLGTTLATPFPRHWRPLFEQLGWRLELFDPRSGE